MRQVSENSCCLLSHVVMALTTLCVSCRVRGQVQVEGNVVEGSKPILEHFSGMDCLSELLLWSVLLFLVAFDRSSWFSLNTVLMGGVCVCVDFQA